MAIILAAATGWRGASRDGVGGLFRFHTIEGRWEHISQIKEAGAQAITVDPRTGVIYVGTTGGVYCSRDGGNAWVPCGHGSAGSSIWSLLVHPTQEGLIIAGLSPRGILLSRDAGATWVTAQVDPPAQIFNIADDGVTLLPFSARVTGLSADYADPSVIYAAVEVEGMIRSTDFGKSWHDCSKGLLALAAAEHLAPKIGLMDGRKSMADGHAIMALDGVLFYANRLGLFVSHDRGETWRDARLDQVSPLTYVRSIVASAISPDICYAALSVKSGGDNGTVWRSTDRGTNWSRFDRNIAPDSTLMAVAVHPANPDIAYATSYSGQLFGTEDGGSNWQSWAGPEGATESYALAVLDIADR